MQISAPRQASVGRASRRGSGKQKSAYVRWKMYTLIYPYPKSEEKKCVCLCDFLKVGEGMGQSLAGKDSSRPTSIWNWDLTPFYNSCILVIKPAHLSIIVACNIRLFTIVIYSMAKMTCALINISELL
jgi:hypothetical protein